MARHLSADPIGEAPRELPPRPARASAFRRSSRAPIVLCALCVFSVACGGSVSGEGSQRDGGTKRDGGSGGASAGGRPGSGGAPADGGASTGGGSAGRGGSGGSGGAPAAGGSAGCGTCGGNDLSTRGFQCCGDSCVNPMNDILNCGACGHRCPASEQYCSGGVCAAPPCSPACASGKLCCTIHMGCCDLTECVDPVQGTCPVGCPGCVCASPDTPIATPVGTRAIASLRVGELVTSVDHGRVVDVPILEVRRVPARNHHVVRVELRNGNVLEISAPHPTADGRTFGDLRAGDVLGGVTIESVRFVPYVPSFTYDILPASDTGTYFAGGVLIGSTMGGSALSSHGADSSEATLSVMQPYQLPALEGGTILNSCGAR